MDSITWSRWLCGLCAAWLGGCAHVWVDEAGQRHVVGLLHLTLPAANAETGGETLRARSVGLSWTQAEAGSALVLGLSDTTLGFLRNDACVRLNLGSGE